MKTITKIICLAFALFAFARFAALPTAQAVVPPPDGGYPGFNTAEGSNALQNLSTGLGNTATGWHSLFTNTTGNLNTAIGPGTLLFNTGDNNTATGALALLSNTTGFYNTADGAFALLGNTEGNGNTATGYQALYANQIGDNNAAYGFTALYHNTGSFNTAFGSQTLVYNTDGAYNTAIGFQALVFNNVGVFNSAIGTGAGYNLTTGNNNVAVGAGAGNNLTTGNHNIDIDNQGVAGESATIRIGQNQFHSATYLAGIAGRTVGAGGTTCYEDNDGKLGVILSARRYKENIQCMDDLSAALFSLKPVTFRYKPEFDNSGTSHFGLIAEEVAEVAPDLVTHDANGQLSTVRYEAVNAMLLNEFLKEHGKVEQMEKQIEALAAGLQKVSAQVEVRKAKPQGAENNQ